MLILICRTTSVPRFFESGSGMNTDLKYVIGLNFHAKFRGDTIRPSAIFMPPA